MSRSVKPLNVSPFIKGSRWSLLVFGVFYGSAKLKAYQAYDEPLRPKRHKEIKAKYERLRKESAIRDTNELYITAKEFEITEFPPGWSDQL